MKRRIEQTEYGIEYASDAIEREEAIDDASLGEALRAEEARIPDEEEPKEKKPLWRDLQKEALRRLEDSARTEEDFRNVIAWWDRLDANRERRERYHEVGRDEEAVPLDWGAKEDGLVFPGHLNTVLWKQMQKGEFLDVIFNCPLEIHELTADEDLYTILRDLKDDHKEIFYYLFICLYSTARVGEIRGQSDRNIRKVRTTILKKIRKKYASALKKMIDSPTLSKEQREFLSSQLTQADK